MEKVGQLLDESIATKGYVIHATEETSLIDLSQIDFEALKAHFEKGRKQHRSREAEGGRQPKLQRMVQLNKSRTDLLEKFKKLIDEYNKGLDVDGFFEKLLAFVQELNEEDQRGVAEQLDEEELAIFDILTKPELDLTADDASRSRRSPGHCSRRSRRRSSSSTGGRSCGPERTCTPPSRRCWTTCHASTRRTCIRRSATSFTATFSTATRARGRASTRWCDRRVRAARSTARWPASRHACRSIVRSSRWGWTRRGVRGCG